MSDCGAACGACAGPAVCFDFRDSESLVRNNNRGAHPALLPLPPCTHSSAVAAIHLLGLTTFPPWWRPGGGCGVRLSPLPNWPSDGYMHLSWIRLEEPLGFEEAPGSRRATCHRFRRPPIRPPPRAPQAFVAVDRVFRACAGT